MGSRAGHVLKWIAPNSCSGSARSIRAAQAIQFMVPTREYFREDFGTYPKRPCNRLFGLYEVISQYFIWLKVIQGRRPHCLMQVLPMSTLPTSGRPYLPERRASRHQDISGQMVLGHLPHDSSDKGGISTLWAAKCWAFPDPLSPHLQACQSD